MNQHDQQQNKTTTKQQQQKKNTQKQWPTFYFTYFNKWNKNNIKCKKKMCMRNWEWKSNQTQSETEIKTRVVSGVVFFYLNSTRDHWIKKHNIELNCNGKRTGSKLSLSLLPNCTTKNSQTQIGIGFKFKWKKKNHTPNSTEYNLNQNKKKHKIYIIKKRARKNEWTQQQEQAAATLGKSQKLYSTFHSQSLYVYKYIYNILYTFIYSF